MMTAIVREAPQAALQTKIPPHVLIVGKKNAVDYITPALFRIGSCGELVVRAKGSLSIVTAVNVAEMVKKDVEGLETRSVKIGTDEFQADGVTRRVSFIEIHLAAPAPIVPVAEAPIMVAEPEVHVPVEVPVAVDVQHVETPVEVQIEAPAVEASTVAATEAQAVPALKVPAKKVRTARKTAVKKATKKAPAKKASGKKSD
jgi:DNA-binding protein Alba